MTSGRHSKEEARALVAARVEQFDRDVDELKAGAHRKEAQIEDAYIKPLFAALNWNTTSLGLRPGREEFLVQATQQVDETSCEPDYLLQLPDLDTHRMRRHLFIEAKHPKYNLHTNIKYIKQAYRYAHSTISATDDPANWVRLTLLTDFEEFRLFDCIDHRPLETGNAHLFEKRIVEPFNWYYAAYVDDFDLLWDIFERNQVAKGSLRSLVDNVDLKQLHRTTPDTRFLADLERWRKDIGQSILTHHPEVSDGRLTQVTQRLIDRLVFVKMLSDRRIEKIDYVGKLVHRITEADDVIHVYETFRESFRNLDITYNGGLFQRKDDIDGYRMDGHVLAEILDELTPERAIYTFAAMPVEIIGHAYEQFLGKYIQREDGVVKIVVKPEVRRAKGVYYTPRHIVDHIVDDTVGRLLADCQTPADVARLKILDPACGSGSFLLGVYARLVAWHEAFFLADAERLRQDKRYKRLVRDEFADYARTTVSQETGQIRVRLTARLRREILQNNIFGVDIDPQAVEVAHFSLGMKALEGIDHDELYGDVNLFHQAILPDLSKNILCGNSLIERDFIDLLGLDFAERHTLQEQVRAFDWDVQFPEIMPRGFDAVIGNPPYDVIEKQRGHAVTPHDMLHRYAQAKSEYGPALYRKLNMFRLFLVRGLQLTAPKGRFGMIVPMALLADLSCVKTRRYVFGALSETVVDCFPQKDRRNERVFRDAKLSTAIVIGQKRPEPTFETGSLTTRLFPANRLTDAHVDNHLELAELALLDPKTMPIPTVSEAEWRVCRRLYQRPDVLHLVDVPGLTIRRGEINQTTFRQYIVDDDGKDRLLKGAEVGAYQVRAKPSQGRREWFDQARFLADHAPKPITEERRIATQRISGVDEAVRIVATIVEPPMYFADSTNSLTLEESSPYAIEYVCALLNSRLFQWRFRLTSTNNNVATNELNALPFRRIDFAVAGEVEAHDYIVDRVRRLLVLGHELQEATSQDQRNDCLGFIARYRKEVDDAIGRIYGLSDDEIALMQAPLFRRGRDLS